MKNKRSNKLIVMIVVACIFVSGCQQPMTYVQDAVAQMEQGEPENAMVLFEKAISKGVQKAEAYRGLGICYYEEGDFLKARGAFAKALLEGTKETGSLYHLWGTSEMQLGNMAAAIELFEKGLAMGDSSAEVTKEMEFNIICAFEKLEDYEVVKARLVDYVEKYPEDEAAKRELDFFATR